MKIVDVILTKSYTGFYFDDQKSKFLKDEILFSIAKLIEGFITWFGL